MCRTVVFRLWCLIFFILFDAVTLYAKDLHESFVWLRISKTRGNNFYRVLVDETETPYLNFHEILTSYLDFSKVKCDQQRKFCDATLASKDNLHIWVDFKEKQCGIYGDEEKGTNAISEDDVVFTEDNFWIKYDVLSRCFPVEAKWDLKLYYLSLLPSYPLVEDLLTARERSRNYSLLTQKKKEEIAKQQPITPVEPYRLHGKYNLQYLEAPAATQTNKKFSYDVVADLVGGTLKFGGGAETGQSFQAANYQTYTMKDKKYFKSLDVGDVFFNGDAGLLPDFTASDGIRLDSKERVQGASINSSIKGQTLPGTDVELYRNSVFLGNMIVPQDGVYTFENIYASGGDNLLLKFYFADGSTSEKNIKVADDGALLLAKKESEVRFFSGNLTDGRFSHLNLRYGAFERASFGLQVAKFTNLEDVSTDEKKRREKPFILTDVVTLPLKSFNVTAESLISENNLDYEAKLNTTIAEPNVFNFQFKHLETTSPILNFPNNIEGDTWKITHGVNIWRFQISDSYQESKDKENMSLNISSFLTSNTNIFAEGSREIIKNQSDANQINGGIRMRLGDYSDLQLSRLWLAPARSNNIEFNIHGGLEVPWNAKFIYSKPEVGNATYNAQISYTLSRRLTFELLAATDKFGFQISLSDVVSEQPGPEFNEDFGTGTVSGYLLSPVDQNGNYYPIVDGIVTVDGRSTRTDEKGYYYLSGITPYRNVELKVDPMGMDVSLAPQKENEVLYFRPGTHIEYNPVLVNTVGLDGFIILPSKIVLNTNLLIDVKSVQNSSIIQTITVENDGFFMIEGLAPGEYLLEIIDPSKQIRSQSKKIKVEASDEWIRDFRWKLD